MSIPSEEYVIDKYIKAFTGARYWFFQTTSLALGFFLGFMAYKVASFLFILALSRLLH